MHFYACNYMFVTVHTLCTAIWATLYLKARLKIHFICLLNVCKSTFSSSLISVPGLYIQHTHTQLLVFVNFHAF